MSEKDVWDAFVLPGYPEGVQRGSAWSGLCAEHSSFSTPTLVNHVFMELHLCTRALSCYNRIGLFSSSKEKLKSYRRHPLQ